MLSNTIVAAGLLVASANAQSIVISTPGNGVSVATSSSQQTPSQTGSLISVTGASSMTGDASATDSSATVTSTSGSGKTTVTSASGSSSTSMTALTSSISQSGGYNRTMSTSTRLSTTRGPSPTPSGDNNDNDNDSNGAGVNGVSFGLAGIAAVVVAYLV